MIGENSNIVFSENSVIDSFGTVFECDGKLYRIINKKSEAFCRDLIDSNLFKELLEAEIIPETKISNDFDKHWGMVLEHQKLIVSKPYEWSYNMLKDAAMFTLNINAICNKH